MKIYFILLLLPVINKVYSQTEVNKTIAIQAGQKIEMHFDYPELIKVSAWDKNEIAITGTVSINGGENDNAFSLESSSSPNEVLVTGEIKDLKKLPHRITIWHKGQKIIFKTKADYKKYTDENGHEFNRQNWGTDIDIFLTIKVPKNFEVKILSTYGTIEVKDFTGSLVAESTYGGVDAALVEKSIGNIKATTNYGQIYTNFDFKFNEGTFEDFHTVVSARLGNGSHYSFESKYGNVYLRKSLN
ncbi:MAG: hypothetical protein JST37_10855 [Bacteroidetes bacterium]|nr:hypothetical protein [Bacteroidota bacterium]MBS1981422.1 hypothetical protein [Bacteroidota bacterium]